MASYSMSFLKSELLNQEASYLIDVLLRQSPVKVLMNLGS